MQKLNLATAIAAILVGSVVMNTAQAAPSASAESVLELSNFKVSSNGTQLSYDTSGGPGAQVTNVSTSETDTADLNTKTVGTPAQPGAPVSQSITSGAYQAPLDSTGPAAGTAVFNNATAVTPLLVANLPVLSGQFAAAASNESGSALLHTPSGPGGATTGANGSTLYSASYAVANANGTQNSSEASDITFKTTLTNINGKLDFTGNIGAYAEAYLSTGSSLSSYADYTFSLSLKDITTGHYVSLIPQGTATQIGLIGTIEQINSVSDGTPGSGGQSITALGYDTSTGAFDAANQFSFDLQTETALNSTDTYQVTSSIHTDTNVDLSTVPEPAMLALLGIGLLGMGVASRKSSKSNMLFNA